jgi:hypothetical protein
MPAVQPLLQYVQEYAVSLFKSTGVNIRLYGRRRASNRMLWLQVSLRLVILADVSQPHYRQDSQADHDYRADEGGELQPLNERCVGHPKQRCGE